MAAQELKQFPRGQIAIGGGDLQQTTNFEWDYSNNAKLVHTLRKRAPAGVVLGNESVTFSGQMVVDEDGPEIDLFDAVATGNFFVVRLKMPGLTKGILGVINNVKGRFTLEDGVQFDYSGVGAFIKS